MKRLALLSAMASTLVIFAAGCSQSPKSRFLGMCNGTDQQCECVANGLSEALGDSKFGTFLDDLEAVREASGENMGPAISAKILSGGAAAESWGAFVGAAKACGLMN